MKIEFTVHGKIRGKGRPRFVRMGKFVKTYTPEETASYENLVKMAFSKVAPILSNELMETHVHVQIRAVFAMPKSLKKRDRDAILSGFEVPCPKKPDMDNICKVVCDSLNGMAYKDDANIVALGIEKLWGVDERLEVAIMYPVAD